MVTAGALRSVVLPGDGPARRQRRLRLNGWQGIRHGRERLPREGDRDRAHRRRTLGAGPDAIAGDRPAACGAGPGASARRPARQGLPGGRLRRVRSRLPRGRGECVLRPRPPSDVRRQHRRFAGGRPRRRRRGRGQGRLHVVGRNPRRAPGRSGRRAPGCPALSFALCPFEIRGRAGGPGSVGEHRRGRRVRQPGVRAGTRTNQRDGATADRASQPQAPPRNHRGKPPAAVNGPLNVIDIADCTLGHLLAEERGVPGERYLLCGASMTLRSGLALLSRLTGLTDSPRFLPPRVALAAAGGIELVARARGKHTRFCREMVRTLVEGAPYDGTQPARELGLVYTPIETTMRRTIAWYLEQGLITRPLPGFTGSTPDTSDPA